MELEVQVMQFKWPGAPRSIGPTLAELAQTAEAIGIRTLSTMDHWFQMDDRFNVEDPVLEGYTALAFVAGKTERLRLRTLVTGVMYRYPGLLAKTVATLDVLSEGRAELGIGAGWYEREHLGLGVPFPAAGERLDRLEETIEICLQMWSDDNGPYRGRYYELAETICSPPPLSAPRPPILIGGGGEQRTLRLVARYADRCNLFGNPEAIAHKVDVLRQHCDEVGRDIAEIEITTMFGPMGPDIDGDAILRRASAYAEVGVQAVVAWPEIDDPAGALERTWGPVMPRLADIG